MRNALWLIPLSPFIGFLLNGLFGSRAGKTFSTAIALLGSGMAAVFGTAAVLDYTAHYHHGERHLNLLYNWFSSGTVSADVAFQLDSLQPNSAETSLPREVATLTFITR